MSEFLRAILNNNCIDAGDSFVCTSQIELFVQIGCDEFDRTFRLLENVTFGAISPLSP